MWLPLRKELGMVWSDTQESSQVFLGDVWSKVSSGSPGGGLGVDPGDEFVRGRRNFIFEKAPQPIPNLKVQAVPLG